MAVCAVDRLGRVVGVGRAAAAEARSGASAIRAAGGCPTGRRCRGSCSCCTPGSPGRTCRPSSASAPASPAGGGSTSGSEAGVWERLHALLLARLACGRRDRVVARGRRRQPRAGEKGGSATGPSPVDRGQTRAPSTTSSSTRPGSRSPGRCTGGNRHDITQLIPLARPRPAGRAAMSAGLAADPSASSPTAATTTTATAASSASAASRPQIARRSTEHGSGLGRQRWVVERTFAWLHQFKRLLVRYERRADIHEAFLALGCCLICFRRLKNCSL